MKKIFCVCCILLSVINLYARGIQEDIKLADEKARLSYALGLLIGADLEPSGLAVDYTAFADGLKTAIEKGEPRLDPDEAVEIVQSALQAAMVKRVEESRVGEAQFLLENSARPEVQVTVSGLQYEVLTEGEGQKPGQADTVRVDYEGILTDGTVFDSSYSRGESEDIPLNRVIPGWAEGLALMSVGSKYRLYIPSELAYGETGVSTLIPPYSTLIFTIELLEILSRPEADFEDAAAESE
ncbi:MAG: FKBP-type peptidyl-prolyl cis-trans isomerase [Treponema sp.]|jgi:FKBP-type peptidyl-prolyl cis-trans isomerase|nr:FKBP-type peptidyl-prolyl cis-trans isomerase [Treponema sp.]